ncbi:MAG: universal stress protein [Caulobacteraceae bacterium]
MSRVQATPSSSPHAVPVTDIRSLVVRVETDPETLPRLEAAVDLAHRFDATLVGVAVEGFPLTDESEQLLPGAALQRLQEAVEDDLRRAEELFRARSAGLRTEWRGAETAPGPEIARLSRAADLIVAGGAPVDRGEGYRAAETADLVMLSGRPVLVAPPHGGRLRGEAVLVAWKDTRESRRALADSLPLLKLAEEVVVAEICDKDAAPFAHARTADVVRHLQRHGVAARAKVEVARDEGTVAALQRQARIVDADLIVAGAYGHSRLGEWAFGGVTRDLLRHPQHFVLLSH